MEKDNFFFIICLIAIFFILFYQNLFEKKWETNGMFLFRNRSFVSPMINEKIYLSHMQTNFTCEHKDQVVVLLNMGWFDYKNELENFWWHFLQTQKDNDHFVVVSTLNKHTMDSIIRYNNTRLKATEMFYQDLTFMNCKFVLYSDCCVDRSIVPIGSLSNIKSNTNFRSNGFEVYFRPNQITNLFEHPKNDYLENTFKVIIDANQNWRYKLLKNAKLWQNVNFKLLRMLEDKFSKFNPSNTSLPLAEKSRYLRDCFIRIKSNKVISELVYMNHMGDITFDSELCKVAELYIERALKTTNLKVPDQLFVFSSHDYPVLINRNNSNIRNSPRFAVQSSSNFYDIPFPTITRKRFGKYFEKERTKYLSLFYKTPYYKRRFQAVWRGTLGGPVGCGPWGKHYFPDNYKLEPCKDESYRASKQGPPELNGYSFGPESDLKHEHPRFRLTKNRFRCNPFLDVSAVSSLFGIFKFWGEDGYMSFEQMANYKFNINVGKNGFADSFWMKLATGSTILHVNMSMYEFYEYLLEPYVHYVPIKNDLSDLCDKLYWLMNNPMEAETIASKGSEVIEKELKLENVNSYVLTLLMLNNKN